MSSRTKEDKVDVRVPFKLDLLGSLGHVTGLGTGCGDEAGAGRDWSDYGDISEHGSADVIKHRVHAGVNLGAVVRLNDVGKAPGRCGLPAVNTAAAQASIAMGLVGVHGLSHISPVEPLNVQAVPCSRGQGRQGVGA